MTLKLLYSKTNKSLTKFSLDLF